MYCEPDSSLGRKRNRDYDDDDDGPQGFQEHRAKRQLSTLPFRQSPEQKRSSLATFQTDLPPSAPPTLADITPVGSDSEDLPSVYEPRSVFSPWSSSPVEGSTMESSQPSPYPTSLQHPETHGSPAYSDDLDMMDSGLLCPPPFNPGASGNIADRIPTPIYAQFSSHIRSNVEKTPSYLGESLTTSDNYTYEQASSSRTAQDRNDRRLPSPISEDETSPSILIEGLSDVQMGDEDETERGQSLETKASPKRYYMKHKHSLRNWGGVGVEVSGAGVRKGFSMGYRSDCEKCRMKVPGHFSHVITY